MSTATTAPALPRITDIASARQHAHQLLTAHATWPRSIEAANASPQHAMAERVLACTLLAEALSTGQARPPHRLMARSTPMPRMPAVLDGKSRAAGEANAVD